VFSALFIVIRTLTRGLVTYFRLSEHDVGIAVRALVDVGRSNDEENVFGASKGDAIDSRNLLQPKTKEGLPRLAFSPGLDLVECSRRRRVLFVAVVVGMGMVVIVIMIMLVLVMRGNIRRDFFNRGHFWRISRKQGSDFYLFAHYPLAPILASHIVP